ncbi:uncharacterized protein LOC115218301 [Argonauta hians]
MASRPESVGMQGCSDVDRSERINSLDLGFIRLLSPFVDDIPSSEHDHAVHCMIYCRTNKLFLEQRLRASIMMQFRFDGSMGFPGGIVDPNETIVMALNRELQEEMSFNVDEYGIKASDHLVSHMNKEKKLVLHFFTKLVTEEDFNKIQTTAFTAKFHETEVLGIINPPLFTMSNGISGLPNFLNNVFAGNAQQQFLYALESCELLTKTEINEALMLSRKIRK